MPLEDQTAVGQAALDEGRWAEAKVAFEAALHDRESPEALDGLGEALWWLGDPRAGLVHRERAFVGFRRAGEPARAARTALAICVSYGVNFGNGPAASGWLARAEGVFADADPGPMRGWLWLMRGYFNPDFEQACELVRQAHRLAVQTGDVDLELSALSDLGGRLVAAGRISDGLALIDEAMAGTLGGECRQLDTVVWASCTMLGACEAAGDLERAQQWLRVIDDFTERYGCPFMYATCRTHYGGLLMAKGRWDQAERELAAAIRMSGAAGPVPHALALTQLAELRLRQGRLEDAEALLPDCNSDLLEARVRLARGEVAVSVRLFQRCAEQAGDTPAAAACLSALVEAQLAEGDLPAARATVDRLEALAATRTGGGYLRSCAALAAGRLALVRGRYDEAIQALHSALDGFLVLEFPVDAALTRLVLARAYAQVRPEIAVAQARSALTVLDGLGAAGADEASALLRSLGVAARSGPRGSGSPGWARLTRREQEVLRLMALGLSNPEIASRLVISRKTAAHHVSRVLAKLGVRNRAEAAAHVGRSATASEKGGLSPT